LAQRLSLDFTTVARGYVEAGKLTVEQLDKALDVLAMAKGGR